MHEASESKSRLNRSNQAWWRTARVWWKQNLPSRVPGSWKWFCLCLRRQLGLCLCSSGGSKTGVERCNIRGPGVPPWKSGSSLSTSTSNSWTVGLALGWARMLSHAFNSPDFLARCYQWRMVEQQPQFLYLHAVQQLLFQRTMLGLRCVVDDGEWVHTLKRLDDVCCIWIKCHVFLRIQ